MEAYDLAPNCGRYERFPGKPIPIVRSVREC